MTERLSGLPIGLLRFARRIRHIPYKQRQHKYVKWMEVYAPRDLQRYLDLCEERKDKEEK